MKTLQECKDEVAKADLYDDWTDFQSTLSHDPIQIYRKLDKAAELYAQQFKDELQRLKEALIQIENPIKFFHKELKEGEQLNGVMANQLSNDPNYLKEIARKALQP